MLEACGLHKRWRSGPALAGFDLRIEAGEVCGLLGHNGAGKTTFARICAGLERPDRGRVLVGGVDPHVHPAAARSLVGLAPQEIALYPTATLRENLRFYGGLARPLVLRDVRPIGPMTVAARYDFTTRDGAVCDGRSIVSLRASEDGVLISSIRALSNC